MKPKTQAEVEAMNNAPNRDYKEMEADLLRGGWERITFGAYQAPWGDVYRGPYAAWCKWAGVEMRKP